MRISTNVLFLSCLFLLVPVRVASAQVYPVLTILEPEEGQAHASGTEVVVRFSVQNFSLREDGWHVHMWVDANGFVHNEAREFFSQDAVNLGVLSEGAHNVKLELTTENHISFNPPIRASVNFQVGESAVSSVAEPTNTARGVSLQKNNLTLVGTIAIGAGALFLAAVFLAAKFIKKAS